MFSKEIIIEYHLEHNIYPPVPRDMWPYVKLAISLAKDGYWEHSVEVNNSTLCHSITGDNISVREVIEAMHLEGFVESEEIE
jgi:hypothetical protein